MFSVVVPAHNEESVIVRCLESLVASAGDDECEIIVVCNGCSDRTAERARSVSGPITVVETPVASKTVALNLGDETATCFPRWYVDADIQLGESAFRLVNAALRSVGVPAAAPSMNVDLSDRSWPIRSYYSIWMRLPYVTAGMIGSGVYVLSDKGRERFGAFPEVVGDDAYVRMLFEPTERIVVSAAQFTMIPPRSLRILIKVRARRRIATDELAEVAPSLADDKELHRSGLRRLFMQPLLWPKLGIYMFVRISAEAVYQVQYRLGGRRTWARDETSR